VVVNERNVEANNKSKDQINLHHFCMQIHSPLGDVLLTNLLKDCNKKILDFSRDFESIQGYSRKVMNLDYKPL
jgi:hypothetical protein